jgi:hypothetical protein
MLILVLVLTQVSINSIHRFNAICVHLTHLQSASFLIHSSKVSVVSSQCSCTGLTRITASINLILLTRLYQICISIPVSCRTSMWVSSFIVQSNHVSVVSYRSSCTLQINPMQLLNLVTSVLVMPLTQSSPTQICILILCSLYSSLWICILTTPLKYCIEFKLFILSCTHLDRDIRACRSMESF